MRKRTVAWTTWVDAAGKLWRVGKKMGVSPYFLYLGERIKAFPHEADGTEWVRQVAVRYGEDVGGQFLAHRTPLIAQNRLWRSVVARLFIDAAETHPLGKRTASQNDQTRPTYVGRENARELLLYESLDRETLEALSGLEDVSTRAWQLAPFRSFHLT